MTTHFYANSINMTVFCISKNKKKDSKLKLYFYRVFSYTMSLYYRYTFPAPRRHVAIINDENSN